MSGSDAKRRGGLTASGWCLLVILVFAAFLRFWGLRDNPAWYLDEGAYLDVSANLAELELRNEALQCLFVHPSLPHPPLFFILSALLIKIVGPDIIAVRFVAAFCSLATVFFLFLLGRESGSRTAGLIAAAAAACFPAAMPFSRWGFTYNLAGLLAVIVLYASMCHLNNRKGWSIWVAAIATGLALVTTYYAVGLVLFITLLVVATSRRLTAGVLLVSLVPTFLYILTMSAFGWEAFSSDFFTTFGLHTGGNAETSLLNIGEGLLNLLGSDHFFLLGFFGLILFRGGHRGWVLLALAATSLEILRQKPDTHIGLYRALFFIPFIMLGLGRFCTGLAGKAGALAAAASLRLGWGKSQEKEVSFCRTAILGIVVSALLIPAGIKSTRGALSGYSCPMGKWGNGSNEDAETAAKFINDRVKKDDYVIAPRNVYWQLDCRYTGYMQAVACDGLETTYYPKPIEPSRFAFPCGLDNAKYFILSSYFNLWEEKVAMDRGESMVYINILEGTGWAGTQPNVGHLVRRMKENRWIPIHKAGEYVIFENPEKLK